MVGNSLGETPNHRANSAKYSSTEVVGSMTPPPPTPPSS